MYNIYSFDIVYAAGSISKPGNGASIQSDVGPIVGGVVAVLVVLILSIIAATVIIAVYILKHKQAR